MGDREKALREIEILVRRAPGSVDMRAARAALLWEDGLEKQAEGEWQFACESIDVGCSKYRDRKWLAEIRRWPPSMVEKMAAFLSIS
mmetsp:Transcript_11388/g.35998  ORF Transcript_11388/g.35998 Transcript_11388/m.35998 type:complete len:87 (+) Transcript_11388:139-399(+)